MKGFDVLKVKSAVKTRNKFDLSRTHLTTMDFGEIVPLMVEETVPGDKFNINANYFSRMAPLVKPTYGKFQFKTVSAFVPYHQIAYDADAWFAGKTSFEGATPVQRTITMEVLHQFAVDCLDEDREVTDITTADYIYTDPSGATKAFYWSVQGKYYIKVLNALGYALPTSVDLRTTSNWYKQVRTVKLSAYPLLAFAKLYNDYMSQSQRFNTSALSSLLQSIKYNKAVTNKYSTTGALTSNALNDIFNNIRLCYENDYFTSAWQSPSSPLTGNSDNIGEISNSTIDTVSHNDFDTSIDAEGTLSQRTLDFLKSFDDWVRRNNYAGSRAVQQIYSRFGIKTDDYKSHYAHVYSTDSMPIQVGDVTATADSKDVPLGDYAGKGIMNGGNNLNIEVSDFGLLLILGYFTITPMNPYGFDRKVLRNAPLDYYNPEFDGMGADAISLGEYFADPVYTPGENTTLDTQVFGYTERYNAYRYGRDVITGEFRNYHSGSDMNTWHTGRLLSGIRSSNGLVAQSSSVNTMLPWESQFNRIFSVTDGSVNHFYLTAQFKVDAIRPMLNLNQVPRLGEGNTTVPRNGNEIS